MIQSPAILSLYAEARRSDDLTPRRTAPVRPARRRGSPFAGLRAAVRIVSVHKLVSAHAR
jgi:hypothetical protein